MPSRTCEATRTNHGILPRGQGVRDGCTASTARANPARASSAPTPSTARWTATIPSRRTRRSMEKTAWPARCFSRRRPPEDVTRPLPTCCYLWQPAGAGVWADPARGGRVLADSLLGVGDLPPLPPGRDVGHGPGPSRAQGNMLRITVQPEPDRIHVTLEGDLAGAWVSELEDSWRQTHSMRGDRTLYVDLTAVARVDRAGRYLLGLLRHSGAHLITSGTMMTELVRTIEDDWPVAGAP